MTETPAKDMAAEARRVFELTALSAADVVPTPITEVAAAELRKAVPLFGTQAERAPDEQTRDFYLELQYACDAISSILPHDPHFEVEQVNGMKLGCYVAAYTLMEDMAAMFRAWELEKAYRDFYDHIAQRLAFYAALLKKDPEGVVEFI